MKTESRFEWVDTAKGIAILMVMWGHAVIKHDVIYWWITTFHVPTFLVITGYLYGKKNKVHFGSKESIIKLAKPYLVFSIISCCTDFAYEYLSSKSISGAVKIAGIDIYKTLFLYGIHALWYLPAYVLSAKLFFVVKNKAENKSKHLIVPLMALVGVGFNFLSPYIKGRVPSSIYMLAAIPVVTVVRALLCTVFITFGYAASKWEGGGQLFSEAKTWIKYSVSGLLLLLSFIASSANSESNLSIVLVGDNPLCFFLSAFLGSVGLMALSSAMQHKSNVLQYFGRNSLILLVTHHSLKFTFLARFIAGAFLPEESFAFGLMVLLLLTLIETLVVEICNAKCRHLFS